MLLKSFGDPTCFKILYILTATAFVCPSDFAKILDLSRPAISHHLTRLRQLGVVTSVRHGQVLCYSLTDTKEAQTLRNVLQLLLK